MSDDGKQVNLARLCWKLHDEFTVEEIERICAEFKVDLDIIELAHGSDSIRPFADLVTHVNRQKRIPDLLRLMEAMEHPTELVYMPDAHWEPRSLSPDIIAKVNGLLGIDGRAYRVLDGGEYHDTGCTVWKLPEADLGSSPEAALDFALRESEQIDQQLQRVRQALAGQPVLAYKGDLSEGILSYTYSNQIVVAATRDPFDILRIEQTEAVNYDYTTAELIGMLQTLDKEFGIDITGASGGVVEFRIAKDLKDLDLDELRRQLLSFRAKTFLPGDLTKTFLSGPIVLFWD